MCLGFDVQQRGVKPIEYLRQRPILKIPPTVEDVNRLLFSKFIGWKCEEEWRSWIRIDEREAPTGFYFYSIDGFVRLREVLRGLCATFPRRGSVPPSRAIRKGFALPRLDALSVGSA